MEAREGSPVPRVLAGRSVKRVAAELQGGGGVEARRRDAGHDKLSQACYADMMHMQSDQAGPSLQGWPFSSSSTDFKVYSHLPDAPGLCLVSYRTLGRFTATERRGEGAWRQIEGSRPARDADAAAELPAPMGNQKKRARHAKGSAETP